MKSLDSNTLDMLIRVRQLGLSHAGSFPTNSAAAELFADVARVITDMQGHSAAQAQHVRAAREKTTHKKVAFDALRALMEATFRTVGTIKGDTSGLADKFRLPKSKRAQDWLAAARSFATDAEPLKDEFIRRGMAATFLDDYHSRIHAVEQSMEGRAQTSAAHVSDTVSVAEAAERGRQVVRELDAVLRNIFADNHAALAEWESASRVERAPRRAKKDTPDTGSDPAKD
jgi:hypothetical protein